jgi:3-hydroxyisobutyrate dehydrogenase
MSRIAFLGLGRMGAPMAAALVRAGHDLTVWNRSRAGYDRLRQEAGPGSALPATAPTPRDAAQGAQIVITMLADSAALEHVLFAADGVAAAVTPGVVVCDMSTIGVEAATRAGLRLAELSVEFIDAPVSGSVPTVRARELLVMAGGSVVTVDLLRDVFSAFARRVIRVGGPGSGQVAKLAVNSVVHALNASVSEALVLAERGGVARSELFDVLVESAVAAPFVKYKRAAFEDPDGQPVAMSVDLMRKDLDVIEALAVSEGMVLRITEAVHRLADEASFAGLGAADMSAVAVHVRHTAEPDRGKRPDSAR